MRTDQQSNVQLQLCDRQAALCAEQLHTALQALEEGSVPVQLPVLHPIAPWPALKYTLLSSPAVDHWDIQMIHTNPLFLRMHLSNQVELMEHPKKTVKAIGRCETCDVVLCCLHTRVIVCAHKVPEEPK